MIITDENLPSFAASLADQSVQEQIALVVEELSKTLQFGEAERFVRSLEQAIKAGSATLDPQSKQFYVEALLKLKFAAFPLLPPPEQRKLLTESLLTAYKLEVDLKERLSFVFFPYYRGKADKPRLNNLVEGFESNNERLGDAPIKLGTSTVEPVVKNWVLDFRQSLREGMDSTVAVATYISNSQNSHSLSSEDQEVLKKLLQTYAWLRFEAVPPEMLDLDLDQIISETPEAAPAALPATPTPPPMAAVSRPPEVRMPPRSVPVSSPAPRPRQAESVAAQLRPAPAAPPPARIIPASAPRQVEPPKLGGTDGVSKIQAVLSAREPQENFHPTFSLSGALAHAGQDLRNQTSGKVQFGRSDSLPPSVSPLEGNKPPAAVQPVAVSKSPPASPVQSAPQAVPARPVPLSPSVPPSAPPSTDTPVRPPSAGTVVDLSKPTPLDIAQISKSSDLQKIQLQDFARAGFEQTLQSLKAKILELAKAEQTPARRVLDYFYHSPLYNLYVAMAVAVMNDAGADQKAAFERVVANYQAAKKDVLTREQFLSLNRFKKEVSQL